MSGGDERELPGLLAGSPFAPLFQDDLMHWATRLMRRNALERLERCYREYAASPSPETIRRTHHALLTVCRLYELSPRHARLLAELGRVDDDAGAPVQLVLRRRGNTRPILEGRSRDAKKRRRSLTEEQEIMFFFRVGFYREANDCGLPAAFEAVADCKDAALYTDQDLARRSVATVKAAWAKWAKRYRKAGRLLVEYGEGPNKRSFHLRPAGRPRKIG